MEKMPKFERATATIDYRVNRLTKIEENVGRKTIWRIKRYESKNDLRNNVVYEEKEIKDCFDGRPQFSIIDGNVLLDAGITEMLTLIASTGATKWDNGNAYLGVGTDDTAEDNEQTGLIGETPTYVAMDATFPQVANQTVTWQSTFGALVGNHAWKEFTVSNSDSNTGDNLNRKVDSQGIKQEGQSWQLQCGVTFS